MRLIGSVVVVVDGKDVAYIRKNLAQLPRLGRIPCGIVFSRVSLSVTTMTGKQ